MKALWWKRAFGAACLAALPSMASAAFIAAYSGHDCPGVFGSPFEACIVNGSPVIAKFEFDDDGDVEDFEINDGDFPSVSGSEFSFVTTGTGTGSWTYSPGTGDPAITFFSAMGGSSFNLFSHDGTNSDSWLTPLNGGGRQSGTSHVTFYDSFGGGNVPEPNSIALALLALGSLGATARVRRRR